MPKQVCEETPEFAAGVHKSKYDEYFDGKLWFFSFEELKCEDDFSRRNKVRAYLYRRARRMGGKASTRVKTVDGLDGFLFQFFPKKRK